MLALRAKKSDRLRYRQLALRALAAERQALLPLEKQGACAIHALIIEDSFLIASAIEGVLRELGFTSFDLAARPEQAIAAAMARRPDLITADARLGDESGVPTVNLICAENDIPVLFIVGDKLDVLEDLPDALIVLKPFTTRGLKDGVQAAMPIKQRVG